MGPKKTKKNRSAVTNKLTNEELAIIVQFVMSSQKTSCENVDAFLSVFAKPGVWKVAAETLGWQGVDTRRQFYNRCVTERQNRMASEYMDHDACARKVNSMTPSEREEYSRTPWIKTNDWVVKGLTVEYMPFVSDMPEVEPEQISIEPKGKQKVRLSVAGHGDPPANEGVAMRKTDACGTKYAVMIRRKMMLNLVSRPMK